MLFQKKLKKELTIIYFRYIQSEESSFKSIINNKFDDHIIYNIKDIIIFKYLTQIKKLIFILKKYFKDFK